MPCDKFNQTAGTVDTVLLLLLKLLLVAAVGSLCAGNQALLSC
jgi:hypothetical protein